MQAYESLLTNIEPIVADDISSFIQEVQRVLQEDDVRLYLWHLSYTITDFKKPLVAIRRFNEDNKKIMNISDEELSAIFKGGKFEST